MLTIIDQANILRLRQPLDQHPVYEEVRSIQDLRCFMSHHVYSVWDFMSLLKFVQRHIAPARVPWVPVGDPQLRRFINQLVLEEESDETNEQGNYLSHFEVYCQAMREIGADERPPQRFVDLVGKYDVYTALDSEWVPAAAKIFSRQTFQFITTDKPHIVAAALALGREHIIPAMYRALLSRMHINQQQAPSFHFYLQRHIELDSSSHADLSLRLLEVLCENHAGKIEEAQLAAKTAIEARVRFWDGVLEAIQIARDPERSAAR